MREQPLSAGELNPAENQPAHALADFPDPLRWFRLDGRVALVTGAGRGIGRSIAEVLSAAGARLMLTARTEEQIADAVAAIRAHGHEADYLAGDVRDPAHVSRLAEQTTSRFGRIDILVNNAGGNFRTPFEQYSEHGWDTLIRENLNTFFLVTQATGRIMLRQEAGVILNISSFAGIRGFPNGVAYGAAKAAVINMTKSLAAEWGPRHIRVNCIAPGAIDTQGAQATWQEAERRLGAAARTGAQLSENVALGRMGRPQEIAAAALFLVSDAASYVTGETLSVAGGLL